MAASDTGGVIAGAKLQKILLKSKFRQQIEIDWAPISEMGARNFPIKLR